MGFFRKNLTRMKARSRGEGLARKTQAREVCLLLVALFLGMFAAGCASQEEGPRISDACTTARQEISNMSGLRTRVTNSMSKAANHWADIRNQSMTEAQTRRAISDFSADIRAGQRSQRKVDAAFKKFVVASTACQASDMPTACQRMAAKWKTILAFWTRTARADRAMATAIRAEQDALRRGVDPSADRFNAATSRRSALTSKWRTITRSYNAASKRCDKAIA